MRRAMLRAFVIVAAWGVAWVGAQAAALGPLKVASYLGEPFLAEAPLLLDEGEQLEDVRVDLADPVDYRILEVYRDPAVDRLRVEILDDARGVRVRISSAGAIDAPFFNLVLKLVAGGVTQFKKYAVFLDPPPVVRAPVERRPATPAQPEQKEAAQPAQGGVEQPVGVVPRAMPKAKKEHPKGFVPFDGWARIGRYGPIVYGDTLFTVARRLRIDDRFTLNQVMVALFRKNPQAFGENNINILKAGVYLDVPLASEVAAIAPEEADRIVREHRKKWEVLKRTNPRYARLAEAQRTRYSKRIRVGRTALGVPAAKPEAAKQAPKPAAKPSAEQTKKVQKPQPSPQAQATAQSGELAALREEISQLRQMNESLQQQLAERDRRIAELEKKLAALPKAPAAAGEVEAELAATKQQLKRLRIRLARMQAELERLRAQKVEAAEEPLLRPIDYALGGLVAVLLGVIGWLLSRRKPEPIGEIAAAPEAEAQAAAEAAKPEEKAPGEEVREIEVEEVPAAEKTASALELSEEDTGEMEPFVAGKEELDPNVDYLAEADVYLRYGLEEEAEEQVRNALKLHPDDPKAWAKLAQLQRQRGDEDALQETMRLARERLSAEAFEQFEKTLSAEAEPAQAAEQEPAESEKTMVLSPEEAETMLSEKTVQTTAPEPEKPQEQPASELDFDLSEIETEATEAEGGKEGAVEDAATAQAEAEGAASEAGELDFDLGELDLGAVEEAEQEPAEPSLEEEKTVVTEAPAAEEAAAQEGETSTAEEASQEQAEEGLDFDLEGMLAEEEEAKAEASEAQESEGLALGEEEIALDFGEEEAEATREIREEELGHVQTAKAEEEAEARASEPDTILDLGEGALEVEPAEEAEGGKEEEVKPAEPAAPAEEEPKGELDLDAELESLDLDELSEAAKELDEFTSTLSGATLEDLGVEQEGEGGQKETGSDAQQGQEKPEDSVDLSLDLGDVEEATQELDDLLSELEIDTDEDEKKSSS